MAWPKKLIPDMVVTTRLSGDYEEIITRLIKSTGLSRYAVLRVALENGLLKMDKEESC